MTPPNKGVVSYDVRRMASIRQNESRKTKRLVRGLLLQMLLRSERMAIAQNVAQSWDGVATEEGLLPGDHRAAKLPASGSWPGSVVYVSAVEN